MCITVRVTDEHTTELVAARPSMRVISAGPYDAFTDASQARDGLVLIGAGADLAPIRSLLEVTTAHPAGIVVVLRAPGPENLVPLDEFRELCNDRDTALHLMTRPCHENHWINLGYTGHNLAMLAPDFEDLDVFICGSGRFVDFILAETRGLGVSSGQHHEERPIL